MNKEKIIQIVSDFNELREKIIDMVCLQKEIEHKDIKSTIINTHENGVSVEIYSFNDFSYGYFFTWEAE